MAYDFDARSLKENLPDLPDDFLGVDLTRSIQKGTPVDFVANTVNAAEAVHVLQMAQRMFFFVILLLVHYFYAHIGKEKCSADAVALAETRETVVRNIRAFSLVILPLWMVLLIIMS
jgi:hypothetical protein